MADRHPLPAIGWPVLREDGAMRAAIGDQLIIHGTHVDEHGRDGEIIDVRGHDGEPPFLVRWSDTGHEALVFPGPDAHVQRLHDEAQPAT